MLLSDFQKTPIYFECKLCYNGFIYQNLYLNLRNKLNINHQNRHFTGITRASYLGYFKTNVAIGCLTQKQRDINIIIEYFFILKSRIDYFILNIVEDKH